MKKVSFLIVIAATTLLISSCIKNKVTEPSCSPVTVAASANEVAALKAYIDSNHIIATQDSRGFFYSIDSSASVTPGNPTICSDVSVTYTGKFLNGTTFDSSGENTPVSFNLSSVILGWQEALPLMKKNSTINLYLPPSLGYGANNYGPIPGNSNLMFTIKLISFN